VDKSKFKQDRWLREPQDGYSESIQCTIYTTGEALRLEE
jgi:hypothetical protein